MADSNDLKVIVGLDVHESVPVIENDLKLLEKALARTDGGKLKITAGLNVGATQNLINQQLKQLKINQIPIEVKANLVTDGKSLNINVNQIGDMSKTISGMTKEVSQYIKAMSLVRDRTGWLNTELEALFKTAKSALDTGDMEKYGQTIERIADTTINRFSDMERAGRKLTEQQKEAIEAVKNTYFPGGLAAIGENDWKDLVSTFDNESNFKKIFRSVFGSNPRKWNGVGASLDGVSNRAAIEGSKDINTAGDALAYVLKTIIAIKQEASSNPITAEQIIPEIDEKVKAILKYDDNIAKANNSVKELTQSEKELVDVNNKIQKLNEDANFAFMLGDDDEFESINLQIKELENRKKVLEGIINQEKTSSAQFVASTAEMQQEEQKLIQNAQKISNNSGSNINSEYLSSNIEKIKTFADNAKTAEQSFRDLLAEMGDTKGSVTSKEFKDATGQVNSFTVAVKSGTGALETFRYSFSEDDGAFKLDNITAANAGIQRLTDSVEKYKATMKAYMTEQKAEADALQRAWSAPSGNKSVKNADNVSALNAKYNELIDLIAKLETVEGNEAIKTKGEIKAKKIEIESMISLYHKMEKAATSLRSKDVDASIIDAQNKVQKFMNEFNGSKVSFTSVQTEMTNLANAFVALGQATDENKVELLHKLLDALGNAQTKFDAENQLVKNFKDLSTEIDHAYTAFKKFDDSSVLKNNFKSQDVIAFRDTVANLRAEYDKLNAELAQTPKTSDAYKKLRADLDTLSPKLKNAENAYSELQTRLRTAGGEQQADARLQRLINRIKEYMAVNTKASKKYGTQFQSLLSQASIKQDTEGIRRLEMEFANLTSQIKIAGDQGKTFGQMLVDNIKKFSSWMSLTSVVMRAWHSLKQMVTTVKELDTAMTAVIRVTQGTKAAYDQFFENAIKNAKELKMDLVDLVNQSAEWAKRGYNLQEAGNLARASGIYSVVADIDNATAVQHLTTVMKTYNMTVEESMDVTDKLDNIANRYAVTAGDLGEILSHSISSMQVSGNTLDQAIAMGTAIAQITGNANEAGSTLKVLSMRLRGAKTEIEAAGEDTEGMAESTSKLREQIMALTNVNGKGGFDIMLDNDTFKSTYEIMEGISKVWKDISDVNQANKTCLYVQKCA